MIPKIEKSNTRHVSSLNPKECFYLAMESWSCSKDTYGMPKWIIML